MSVSCIQMEQVRRIELPSQPWQGFFTIITICSLSLLLYHILCIFSSIITLFLIFFNFLFIFYFFLKIKKNLMEFINLVHDWYTRILRL